MVQTNKKLSADADKPAWRV